MPQSAGVGILMFSCWTKVTQNLRILRQHFLTSCVTVGWTSLILALCCLLSLFLVLVLVLFCC